MIEAGESISWNFVDEKGRGALVRSLACSYVGLLVRSLSQICPQRPARGDQVLILIFVFICIFSNVTTEVYKVIAPGPLVSA